MVAIAEVTSQTDRPDRQQNPHPWEQHIHERWQRNPPAPQLSIPTTVNPPWVCDMGGGRREDVHFTADWVEPNSLNQAKIQPMKRARVVGIVAFAIALAAPAHADVDGDGTVRLVSREGEVGQDRRS
jgi:hypothetical protein